jgi:hypothetical protein
MPPTCALTNNLGLGSQRPAATVADEDVGRGGHDESPLAVNISGV